MGWGVGLGLGGGGGAQELSLRHVGGENLLFLGLDLTRPMFGHY